jgi:hypothetical protein
MTTTLRSVLQNQIASYRSDLEANLKLALENAGPDGDFYVAYDATTIAAGCLRAIDLINKQLDRIDDQLLDTAEAMCPGA